MTRHVWFIRHGESISNAGGVTSSSESVPLTAIGERQAQRAADVLVEKPSLIIQSPYKRAQQTAEPTINRWPDVEVVTWPVHEFTYLSRNKLGPTTPEQRQPSAIRYWEQNDPDYRDGEDSESFNSFIERVEFIADKLKALETERTYIFSHGLFLKILFFHLANQDTTLLTMQNMRCHMNETRVHNGEIFYYHINQEGYAELKSRSTKHLDGLQSKKNSITD